MWLALGFVSGYLVIFYAAGNTKEMLLLTNVFLMNLMSNCLCIDLDLFGIFCKGKEKRIKRNK